MFHLHSTCNNNADILKVAAILVASGNSERMGFDKIAADLCGTQVLIRSVAAFEESEDIEEIVVVVHKDLLEYWKENLLRQGFKKVRSIVCGGETRQKSASNGVMAVSRDINYLCIHDGARPLVSKEIIKETIKAAVEVGAAAPAVSLIDTVKQAFEGFVISTPERSSLFCVQTPQVFRRDLYLEALEKSRNEYSDDCQLIEAMGKPVVLTKGSYKNVKITSPVDFMLAELHIKECSEPKIRIGHGYDMHKLAENRKLVLGGVELVHPKGLLGHSDADVLLHAIMDALLGAAAMGDIGQHFPDTNKEYKDVSSRKLLCIVIGLLKDENYSVLNIDATIVAQKPKVSGFIERMKNNIAEDCGIDPSCINVKATTEEGLGVTGSEQGIAAHAVCLIVQKNKQSD